MTLNQIKVGEICQLVDLPLEMKLKHRLMTFGLLPGSSIQVLGLAPLGDPIELLVRGCRLSLRLNEAKQLRVTPLKVTL